MKKEYKKNRIIKTYEAAKIQKHCIFPYKFEYAPQIQTYLPFD